MKDKFNQTYLEIINESERWQDSLGGKLVTGIGSLFKRGAKVASSLGNHISSGIQSGIKSTKEGISNFIKQRDTKRRLQDVITNITSVYNPIIIDDNSVGNLIKNKQQLNYILKSANGSIPPNLQTFLNIFQTTGKDLKQLIKNDPSLLRKDQMSLRPLIHQPLIQKIDAFKNMSYSKLTTQQYDLTNIYYNIILQQSVTQIQQDIQVQAKNNGFFQDGTNPLKMHKEYNGVKLLPSLNQPQLSQYQDIIKNDKVKISLEIVNAAIKCNIISDSIKIEKQYQLICNDATTLMSLLFNAIKQYYINGLQSDLREKQLNIQVSLAKLRRVKTLLEVSNDVIDNDIKWDSWFGSLKRVLQQAAMCKIDIQKLKLLAKLYFQINLVNS